jgi:transposase-like protein
MPALRKYPDELGERAIRLAMDARKDPATRPGALRRVAEQLGINPGTLQGWVSQAEIGAGHDQRGRDPAGRAGEGERELRRANSIQRSGAYQVLCVRD